MLKLLAGLGFAVGVVSCARPIAAPAATSARNAAADDTPDPPPASSPANPSLRSVVFGADALAGCDTDLIYLNQVMGWQVRWPREWARFARSEAVTDADFARWSAVPEVLDRDRKAMAGRGDDPGAAPAPVVRRVLGQIEELSRELGASDGRYRGGPPRWRALRDQTIVPAVERFAAFLRTTYLPRAPERPGLGELPGGRGCFRRAVEWWTSVSPTPDAIVATGERLLQESRQALGADADGALAKLREAAADETGDRLVQRSKAALARAHGAVAEVFRFTPPVPAVIPMVPHLRASFPAGYYRAGPTPAYVVNPSRPGERRLMAEVIAFHEGIPGHHLFAAYPRPGGLGPFNAGLLEGWAIYAEYLADELGLYSSEYDRQGMIAKHLWAASRLIVEPGLHLHGWSRQQAIDYMARTTALARKEIALEVDRYIAMPGQSLAYMLGYDAIASARRRAEAALGARFDLSGFHHAVIEPGSRSLAQMNRDVDAWVASVRPAMAGP